MGIDIADPAALQAMQVDESAHLRVRSERRRRKVLQIVQYGRTIGELTQHKLSNDERVTENALLNQQARQLVITGAQMVHPHRGIDEDHLSLPV